MPDGTISTIRPDRDDDRGFGRITPDGGGPDLLFTSRGIEGAMRALGRALQNLWHPAARRGKPFAQLRVGQRVTFVVGADGLQAGRARAEGVRPHGGAPRAFDCGCGVQLGGADDPALFRTARAHLARAHPGLPLTDPQLHRLLALDAYTVGDTPLPGANQVTDVPGDIRLAATRRGGRP